MEREKGYYWAKYDGEWVIAEYVGDDEWCSMPYSCPWVQEESDFDEIGGKIEHKGLQEENDRLRAAIISYIEECEEYLSSEYPSLDKLKDALNGK